MDSLMFHLGPPCPTLLCPAGGGWGVTPKTQDGLPVTVIYPFGHTTPYTYDWSEKKLAYRVSKFMADLPDGI
jgi:hypothetical protein